MEEIMATLKVMPMSHKEKLDMAVDMVKDTEEGISGTAANYKAVTCILGSVYDVPDEMFN